VFKNGVLRKKVGPKWDEVTGQWKRLPNEEFHDMFSLSKYYLGDKIKKNVMASVCC